MLINISPISVEDWNEKQYLTAIEKYKEIAEISYPEINPESDNVAVLHIAKDVAKMIFGKVEPLKYTDAVLVGGELNFTFALVYTLRLYGIFCVAATYKTLPDGKQEFVQFRQYV